MKSIFSPPHRKKNIIILKWKNFKLEILLSLEIYFWIYMKHDFFL